MGDDNDDIPGIDPEILARAEQAVAALGGDFIEQTKAALEAHRAQLESTEALPGAEMLRDIFAFAHDLRGQGGSFGYPLLSSIGESLCHFLEARDFSLSADDDTVIRAHLEAAAAILSNRTAGDGDAISKALLGSLAELVGNRLGESA